MPERFTVIGGLGFIGRHVVDEVRRRQFEVVVPSRNARLDDARLGHVIYCAGVTGDFPSRPLDTVRAHSCDLAAILGRNDLSSLLYLSSTRLYDGLPDTGETAPIRARPLDPSHLYNISKLLGEVLCLSDQRPAVRVVRLSNVFGHDQSSNFLSLLLRSAAQSGRIVLHTALESERDYVSVEDVAALLPSIALDGQERMYNVASGINTTTQELIDAIVGQIGFDVEIAQEAPVVKFPRISVERLKREFPWSPRGVGQAIPQLLAKYRQEGSSTT